MTRPPPGSYGARWNPRPEGRPLVTSLLSSTALCALTPLIVCLLLCAGMASHLSLGAVTTGNFSVTPSTTSFHTYMHLLRGKRRSPSEGQTLLLNDSIELLDSLCAGPGVQERLAAASDIRLPACDFLPLVDILPNAPSPDEDVADMCLQPWSSRSNLTTQSTTAPETYFSSPEACRTTLTWLLQCNSRIGTVINSFNNIMSRFVCIDRAQANTPHPGELFCDTCKLSYKRWVCTKWFQLYRPLDLESNGEENSAPKRIPPCPHWCTAVEQDCPYYKPVEGTWNGGEPTFLCNESHYHHSSLYQPPSEKNYGEPEPAECCYAPVHLFPPNISKPRTITALCRRAKEYESLISDYYGNDAASDNVTSRNDTDFNSAGMAASRAPSIAFFVTLVTLFLILLPREFDWSNAVMTRTNSVRTRGLT